MLRDASSTAFVHRLLRARLNITMRSAFLENLVSRTKRSRSSKPTSHRRRHRPSPGRGPAACSASSNQRQVGWRSGRASLRRIEVASGSRASSCREWMRGRKLRGTRGGLSGRGDAATCPRATQCRKKARKTQCLRTCHGVSAALPRQNSRTAAGWIGSSSASPILRANDRRLRDSAEHFAPRARLKARKASISVLPRKSPPLATETAVARKQTRRACGWDLRVQHPIPRLATVRDYAESPLRRSESSPWPPWVGRLLPGPPTRSPGSGRDAHLGAREATTRCLEFKLPGDTTDIARRAQQCSAGDASCSRMPEIRLPLGSEGCLAMTADHAGASTEFLQHRAPLHGDASCAYPVLLARRR